MSERRRGLAVGPWILLVAVVSGLSCQPTSRPGGPSAQPPVIRSPLGIEMVSLPAGKFLMGCSSGAADEKPVHEVSIDALLVDRCETTQEQFGKLVLGNPSHFKGPTRPVEQVSWAEAARFCNERSRREGLRPCYNDEAECNFQASGYRLPTEAEWEYACRAGTETDYYFGPDPRGLGDHAWYGENSGKTTHPVAEKKPNPWGLYDMYGNVAEWCNEPYDANYYASSPKENPRGPADGERYVLRGGAWNSSPKICRSASRIGENAGFQDACFARDAIGFRCVRRPPAAKAATAWRAPWRALGVSPVVLLLAILLGVSVRVPVRAVEQRKPIPKETPPQTPAAHRPTGLVYGDIYLRHDTGPSHPERPQRLKAIVRRLEKSGLMDDLVPIRPAPAEKRWLLAIHTPGYVERLEKTCLSGAPYMDSIDTPVCGESFQVALAAVGGVLAAVDAVVEGRVRNAFCAIRPPGHHATKDRAMGFCLLSNVAIATRYVQKKHKLARVLIVDWDVHHGNGTQAAFNDDPAVLYFSVHRDRFYPGTGSALERGSGRARGSKINVPLPAGSGDRQYQEAFEQLAPAAKAFRPDFVFISAGFDAGRGDPLGGMNVSSRQYAAQTRIVRQIADTCCRGRLVSVLEGGYGLEGLAEAVEAHVRALSE